MAVAFVKDHPVVFNKTAGTTLALVLDTDVPAGNLIVSRVLFDNAGTASKPLISSIGRATGETNTWQLGGSALSTSTSAGAFASGQMHHILTTVTWPAGSYTVTLDTSVTQKAGFLQEFSGTQASGSTTRGFAYSTTTTAASASTSGGAPSVGGVMLGFIFGSNVAAAQAGDNDSLEGSWSTPVGVGSTGGSGATNNFGVAQYKIITGTSHQTLNNSAAMTAGNGAVIVFLPQLFLPAITQAAYRFYADGTETGATALAGQDTAPTVDTSSGDVNLQVRVRLQSTTAIAVPATDDYQLQWEKNTSGTWTNVALAGTVNAYDSTNLTDAAATTNRLGAGTGSFVAGKVSEDGLVDNLGWTANNHTEVLYSVTLKQADLAPTDTVRFRVLRNGATTGLTYTQVPTVTIGAGGPTDRTGTATGSITLGGSASGTKNVTGAATGALTVAGVAAGAPTTPGGEVTGTATGQLAVEGTAAGVPGVTATATGAVALAGTATGLKSVTATATGALTLTGVATGTPGVTASATGALTLSGTAAGVPGVTATATGSLTITGTAAGIKTATATATGTLTISGVAVGTPGVVAAATGNLAVTGTATGARGTAGTATGALTLSGTAAAAKQVTGTATGQLVVSSSALGLVEGNAVGTATGTLTLAGSATGRRGTAGSAAGQVTLAGTVTARRDVTAVATGQITLAATAAGVAGVTATATGHITLTGVAVATPVSTIVGEWNDTDVVAMQYGDDAVVEWFMLMATQVNATATGGLILGGAATATVDVPGTATGTLTIIALAAGIIETPVGPCTEVLSEPFDHLAAWTSLSLAGIVAGRTGNGLQITGAGAAVHLFAANESAHLTCGFAYQVSNLAAARSVLVARSDNGATTQLTFMVTTGGAIEVRRGGTAGTVLGTTAAGLVVAATWVYIEMQVFLDDTAGTVVVNTGGTQRLSIGPLDTRFGGTEAVLDGIGLGASSGANTLFDDLYLTTGSGCPFQGDHTVASTVSFKASLGQAVATTSGTTLVITTTAAIAGGDLVVVRVASDNLNATTPTFTAADSGGNSYTTHAQKAINATAALGIAGAVICSRATNPIAAGGTITVTLSGAVAARAAYAESFAGYINTTRSTPVTASAASATPNTLPSGTVNAGDLVVAACAVETRTAPTGDADTTGGTPWSTLVQLPNTGAGTDTDAVLISGQHKIAALSSAQTYNQTTVNTDWAAMVVVLQRA